MAGGRGINTQITVYPALLLPPSYLGKNPSYFPPVYVAGVLCCGPHLALSTVVTSAPSLVCWPAMHVYDRTLVESNRSFIRLIHIKCHIFGQSPSNVGSFLRFGLLLFGNTWPVGTLLPSPSLASSTCFLQMPMKYSSFSHVPRILAHGSSDLSAFFS